MNRKDRKAVTYEAVTGECRSTMDPRRWPGAWRSRVGWHDGLPDALMYDKELSGIEDARTIYLSASGFWTGAPERMGAWKLVLEKLWTHETACPFCGDGADNDGPCPMRETKAQRKSKMVQDYCDDGWLSVGTVTMAIYTKEV